MNYDPLYFPPEFRSTVDHANRPFKTCVVGSIFDNQCAIGISLAQARVELEILKKKHPNQSVHWPEDHPVIGFVPRES
jgi:sugar diacid utilization regulator